MFRVAESKPEFGDNPRNHAVSIIMVVQTSPCILDCFEWSQIKDKWNILRKLSNSNIYSVVKQKIDINTRPKCGHVPGS